MQRPDRIIYYKVPKSKAKAISNKRNWYLYLIGFLLWAFWISGLFGNSGLLQVHRLSNVRDELQLRVKALENEQNQLSTTLNQLQNDPEVQQRTIREVLGHVKKNELVFEFH